MHYTINKPVTEADLAQLAQDQHIYVPSHSLGNGWTRQLVELEQGDTAANPASTKGPIYGPGFVCYDLHTTGITTTVYKDAGEFYDDIYEARKRYEMMMAVDG